MVLQILPPSKRNLSVMPQGLLRLSFEMTPRQKKERQLMLTTAHFDYGKGLHARAFFKMNDRAMSDDLVQDTFTKTWKYLAKGGKIELMKAFLYHVLNNLIVDEYRKRKTTSLDVLIERGFDPGVPDAEHFFNALDGKAALLLIQRLPEKYQKIMRMRHIQDLSLAEISLITGQSKSTTAVQLHRGLVKLKLLYKI